MDREPSNVDYDAWLEGIQHEHQWIVCEICNGEGTVEGTESIPDFGAPLGGEQQTIYLECEECDGRGEVENEYADYDEETLRDIFEDQA